MSRVAKITKHPQRTEYFSDIPTNFDLNAFTNQLGVDKDFDAINNSIRKCILTMFDEVPYEPLFGSNIKNLLFENDTPDMVEITKTLIEQSLNQNEKRIQVIDIMIDKNFDDNEININITYAVVYTGDVAETTVFIRRIR